MASSSLGFEEEKMAKHETSDVVSSEKLTTNLIQAADVEENIQGSSPPELGESGISISDPSTEKQIIACEMEKGTSSEENKILGKRKLRSDEGEELPEENVDSPPQRIHPITTTYLTRSRRRQHIAMRRTKFFTVDENESVEMEVVHGHTVRASVAPTVRFIFAKYGDVAFNTWFNYYQDFCGTLLEMTGDVVRKIINNNFCYVLSELDGMKKITEVVAMGEVDVSWLQKELAEIDKVRNLTIKAAARDFDAKGKIMNEAKKRLKEIQRRLDHVDDSKYTRWC